MNRKWLIILDNYSGYNKNNHVAWLAAFLRDSGYFNKVEFLFLVAGHTKISLISFSISASSNIKYHIFCME